MFGNLGHSHCQLSLHGQCLDEVRCSNKTVDLFQSCTSGWWGSADEHACARVRARTHTHTDVHKVMMT